MVDENLIGDALDFSSGNTVPVEVTFDQIDIIADTRQFKTFDMVVAIEIIEHVYDYKTFLQALIRFDTRTNKNQPPYPTEYYISTPNRNNKSIRKDKPYNIYHVREWTAGEFLAVLKEYFQNVNFYSAAGVEIPESEYETTTHTPLLAVCSVPKL